MKLDTIYENLQETVSEKLVLIAGKRGLINSISAIHFVEGFDITTFLRGGELIIITGIALKNKDDLVELVKLAIRHSCGGIIINIGPYITGIDQAIITLCDENGVPLFKVPWEVYMADIVTRVVQQLTMHTTRQTELVSAVKNAVCMPFQHEYYIPILQRYDYNVEWHYCAAAFSIETKQHQLADDAVIEKIIEKINVLLPLLAPDTIVFSLQKNVIFLFSNRTNESIVSSMKQFYGYLSEKFTDQYLFYIGIGRNTKSARCIYKTYTLAVKITGLQKRLNHSGIVTSYKELGISKLFLSMEDSDIMKEYYDEKLRPLVEYDDLNDSDFTGFLETYFECDCNTKETAQKLNLHRNTITYRLEKIEEVLNVRLNSFSVKNELLIALKLRYVL